MLYLFVLYFHLPEDTLSEAYSETSQKSKMELYAKMLNGFKPITIFAKYSILDL